MKKHRFLSLIFIFLFSIAPLCACSSGAVDSSAAPHRDGTETVVKKGIGLSRYNDGSNESAKKINDLGVGWYYNWGMDNPGESYEGEYVPMIWGKSSVTSANLQKIKSGYENGAYSHLLTFNEPDNKGQSNMTVEEAIALWPQLESLGIPLSSPCPADYSYGWLDDFMEAAKKKNYRVDFIAIHCYQDFSQQGAANLMKSTLTAVYEKYALPIWLTEFGAIDISVWAGQTNKNCTLKAAKEYVYSTTKMLESLGFVERYAWFLDNFSERGTARPSEAPYTSLYDDNDKISETGKIYKSIASNPPLVLETENLPTGKKGSLYAATVNALGGKGDYVFTATLLPKGLSISTAGNISGKPEVTGTYTARIAATDESGQTAYRFYTLRIE